MRLLRALLGALLRLHPAGSRRRYGAEMVDVALARVGVARRERGRVAGLRLALVEVLGMVRAAAAARRPPGARGERRPRRRLGALAGLAGAAALRLRRRPAAVLGAALPLALGIGLGVPVLAVFYSLVLRPLPFEDPERLVAIFETNPERGWVRAQVAPANYLDWRAQVGGFADIAAHNDWLAERILVTGGEAGVANAVEVTGNLFDVLGVEPLLGESFDDRHTWRGPEPAALLSHRFWSRHYGADPAVVGRTLELDGVRHRIRGVMPAGFDFPFESVDLWVPVAWDPAFREEVWFRRAHGMRAIGRLAEGVSLDEASAELAAVARRLEGLYPETNTEMGNGAMPFRTFLVGDARRPLLILLAAVGFVLLVACANVTHLLLAQANERARERWIRRALGAARRRLALESLAESAVVAALAGAGGVALGLAGLPALAALAPPELGADATASPAVVALAAAASAACVVLFGSLPAWRAGRAGGDAGPDRTGTAPPRARRLASALVAGEVALTLPLVFGAGLMVRTLSELWDVEPGFEARGVVTARVMLPETRYGTAEQIAGFYRDLLDELGSVPGVERVALSTRLPFRQQRWSSGFTADGWPASRYGVEVRHDEISPGLFEAMGVPLLRGRDFTEADGVSSEPVVIVNRALAETYFPGEDPVGRRVTFDRVPDERSVWRTVVGVVGNVRRERLSREETPSFYAPVMQDVTRGVFVLVRGGADPAALIPSLRARLHGLDPGLPLFEVAPLAAIVDASVARERFLLTLLAAAGAVALLLAASGVFAVVLYTTTRRTRELGIRMALGSSPPAVAALAMRSGLSPALGGAVAGLALTAVFAESMSGLVYGVAPRDPATLAGVALLLAAAAGLAALVPARRALRLDPGAVLRAD